MPPAARSATAAARGRCAGVSPGLVTWRPWLEDRVLRQMQGLPLGGLTPARNEHLQVGAGAARLRCRGRRAVTVRER